MRSFYEFFAGGGMARMGLGPGWKPVLINDYDAKKASAYRQNWGGDEPVDIRPIQEISADDLPGCADLAWASFPCQDLSIAGAGAGLSGKRSGSFWSFWNLIQTLNIEGRAPRGIVLENVNGMLTSHGGRDFAMIAKSFSEENYRFGGLVIDAVNFLPQSRPRLFILALRADIAIPSSLVSHEPTEPFQPRILRQALSNVHANDRKNWVWWTLPKPMASNQNLADVIEANPTEVKWHSKDETECLLKMMNAKHRSKVTDAQSKDKEVIGTIYRRTRTDKNGQRRQQAEVRFDGIAGCLRTPGGGSSRQTIIVVNGANIRSRLLSPREAARLMGLPDSYQLPSRYNEAYHLIGDGVAVPVVKHLAKYLLGPLLSHADRHQAPASSFV